MFKGKLDDGTEVEGYTLEEVNARVLEGKEEGRIEEKNKLYSRITKLEEAEKTLKMLVESLTSDKTRLEKELNDKTVELKTLVDTKSEGLTSDEKERQTLKDQVIEQAKTLEALSNQLEETTKLFQKSQLEQLKARVLQPYGEKIILGLVQGTTEEDLVASAEEAHKEYLRIRGEDPTKNSAATATIQTPKPEDLPKNPPAPVQNLNGSKEVKVPELSMEEYKTQRLQLIKQAGNAFRSAATSG